MCGCGVNNPQCWFCVRVDGQSDSPCYGVSLDLTDCSLIYAAVLDLS